jgi:rhodanese-related sulfurtransferase
MKPSISKDGAMERIYLWLASIAILASLFPLCVACGEGPGASRTQDRLLEPKDAWAFIQKNKDNPRFVVLDVRTPTEFRSGHIEGAINIDFNSGHFRKDVSALDPEKTYFVYCRTGRRTAEAVQIMKDFGFNNIVRMKGDIVAWKEENLPLVSSAPRAATPS